MMGVNIFKAISAISAIGASKAWKAGGLFWALTGWLWTVACVCIDPQLAILVGASWISLWILGFWLSRKAQ